MHQDSLAVVSLSGVLKAGILYCEDHGERQHGPKNAACSLQWQIGTHNCEECEKQNCHVLLLFFKLLGLKFKFKLFGTKW